jgi:hypothetical protein
MRHVLVFRHVYVSCLFAFTSDLLPILMHEMSVYMSEGISRYQNQNVVPVVWDHGLVLFVYFPMSEKYLS